MDYKLRLKQFNSTDKYRSEVEFLIRLMDLGLNDKVLDYGCGTGYLVELLRWKGHNVHGYDKFRYVDESPEWYITETVGGYDHVYFMHSFAHIPDIDKVLMNLRDMLKTGGRITVLTPNSFWLRLNHNPSYVPDPTVHKHYTASELRTIFERCGYFVEFEGGLGQVTDEQNERLFIQVKR